MGRKVLISFVGTGPATENGSKREYRTATYRYNEREIKSSFVSIALGEFLNIDTYFLFGTMKSMWEEVYFKFSEKRGENEDLDYYEQLSACSEANHKSELEQDLFTQLENTIGGDSKVFPIYYGLNQQEIQNNFEIMVEAMQFLKDGDEVYLDITHSFRSLPLFSTTALSFIKDVSNKKVEFKGIYYGMLDISREFEDNIVPIVDLSYISNLQEWIKGAYSFSHYSNGTTLSELLKDKNKTASDKIKEFTQVISMNYLNELKTQISQIITLTKEDSYKLPERLIVPQVFKNFADKFNGLKRSSEFQFVLSQWHYENGNYALAYQCLVESIVTFVCEKEGFKETDNASREEAKNLIYRHEKYYSIKEIYTKSKGIRNRTAHAINDNSTLKSGNAVKDLSRFIREFKKILNNAH